MSITTAADIELPTVHFNALHLDSTLRLRSSIPPANPISEPTDDIPDGGYGWVIVAACAVLTFFNVGLMYSWGVIQSRLSTQNLGNTSTLAFIGSLASSFVASFAILNTKIIRRLGTRYSAIVASSMMGLGQILSGSVTHSIGGLFITNGVILGVGVSIVFMATSSLPAQYFKRRRGLANGLVYSGGGVGGAVLSLAIDSLLARIGVMWTFRFLGLVTLLCTIPASILLKDRTVRPIAAVDWHLFKDPKFLLLFIGSGIATFPLLVPPFFIPLYALSLGISHELGAALLAAWSISSAFGRVGYGWLADLIGPINSLLGSLILTAVSLLAIWPVSNSLAPFILFIIGNGLGNGGFFSTMPSVVGHIYGPSRLPTALAMVVSAWAAGYILGAPIAGYILEKYGGDGAGSAAYRPAMYYSGTMSLGSVAIIFTLRTLVTERLLGYT